MIQLPQLGDIVTLKEDIGLGDMRGRKFKVVYINRKKNKENYEWYEIGCEENGQRFCVTEGDIQSIIEGKEKVLFT